MPSAEVVAIGDELLSGETVDTNSSHIDDALEELGYGVLRHQTVPDSVEAIGAAVQEAAARADVVITTGGLGPTQDDLTFEGVARALGVGLELHSPTLERIEARFAKAGRPVSPNNRRQALLPSRGEALDNEVGTAPGFETALGKARIFVLPGVPREMRWLLEHRVLPRLPPGDPVVRQTIAVAGIGESQLEMDLLGVIGAHPGVRFGFRTRVYENQVKLLARGPDAAARVEAARRAVHEVLGPRIFGENGRTLEASVLDALREAGHTVAVAESCTGGWLGKLLTDVPGSSASVLGGVVAYANPVKERLLGVDPGVLAIHGAVSDPVARQMAEGVRARLGATWGIGTTGIAGPGGGTEEKPVGLVFIALSGPDPSRERPGGAGAGGSEATGPELGGQGFGSTRTEVWQLRLPGRSREVIRLATAKAALEHLRRRLLEEDRVALGG